MIGKYGNEIDRMIGTQPLEENNEINPKKIHYKQTLNGAYDVIDYDGSPIAYDVSLEYAKSLCEPTVLVTIARFCRDIALLIPSREDSLLGNKNQIINVQDIEYFLRGLGDTKLTDLNLDLRGRVEKIGNYLSDIDYVRKGVTSGTTKHGMYSVHIIDEDGSTSNVCITKQELTLLGLKF